jgi:hypothetical protein
MMNDLAKKFDEQFTAWEDGSEDIDCEQLADIADEHRHTREARIVYLESLLRHRGVEFD